MELKAHAKEEAVHMQTAPSRPKKYLQRLKERLENNRSKRRQRCSSIENYGSTASEEKIPRELLLVQSERQGEYDHDRGVQILKHYAAQVEAQMLFKKRILDLKRPLTTDGGNTETMRSVPDSDPNEKFHLFFFKQGKRQGENARARRIIKGQVRSAQSERQGEYARARRIIKGQETVLPQIKYEEDLFINNHTTAWGSWWKDHQWGYSCCKQMIRNSYCTGAAGMEYEAATDFVRANIACMEITEDKPAPPVEDKKLATWGTDMLDDLILDQKRLIEALKKAIAVEMFVCDSE